MIKDGTFIEVEQNPKKGQLTWTDIFLWASCSIGTKTLFFIVVAFVIMLSALLAIILIAVPLSFYSAEIVTVNQSSRRVNRVLLDLGLDFSRSMTQYFTAWDESYEAYRIYSTYGNNTNQVNFIFNGNFDQIQMPNYQVNIVAIYFINGTLIKTRTFDPDTGLIDSLPLPPELRNFPFFGTDDFTQPTARAYQFISSSPSGKTYLVVANPIQTSLFQGPIYAIAAFGREITPAVLYDMATRSQLCITLYSTNNATQNNTISQINLSFSTNVTVNYKNRNWINTYVGAYNPMPSDTSPNLLIGRYCWNSNTSAPVETLTQDEYAGYNLYSDLSGGFHTIIRFDQPRPLQTLSESLIALIVALLCTIAVITFVLVLILLVVLVIYRLLYLTKQIRDIWQTEDFSMKVELSGGDKDEIGILTNVINNMLETINISKQKISAFAEKVGKEQEKIKTFLNVLPDPIGIIRANDGSFYYLNQTFIKSFGYSQNDLEQKKIENLILDNKLDDIIKGGFECNVSVKDGTKSRCDIISSVVDIEEEGRTQTLYVIVLRKKDIEEETLKQQNKELVEKNKVLLFDEAYKDEELRVAYRKFLTKQKFSTISIDFLDNVQQYKSLDQFKRSEMLKSMIEKYFSENSGKLHLSQDDLISLKKDLELGLGESNLFKKYEYQIKLNLINESFTRFESEYSEKKNRKKK